MLLIIILSPLFCKTLHPTILRNYVVRSIAGHLTLRETNPRESELWDAERIETRTHEKGCKNNNNMKNKKVKSPVLAGAADRAEGLMIHSGPRWWIACLHSWPTGEWARSLGGRWCQRRNRAHERLCRGSFVGGVASSPQERAAAAAAAGCSVIQRGSKATRLWRPGKMYLFIYSKQLGRLQLSAAC